MKLVCLDLETFYSTQDYTLKKMTTEEYVRNPRFAPICMGYKFEGGDGWVRAADIPAFLATFDWKETTVLCHNAQFDGLILNHHYGVRPKRFACTLSMARAMYPGEKLSLEALAQKLDLGSKSVPYHQMDGVHPSAMSESLLQTCGRGAANDCAMTVRLYRQMLDEGFPPGELPIVDFTVQMFTHPQLQGDASQLMDLQQRETEKREALLADLGITAKDLGSDLKFQTILEEHGIEVAMKQAKNGPKPATAATDLFMQELLESDEPTIAALAEARLAVKSTIRATRAGRLAATALRGAMPVYLKYFGATRTGRWSGGDRSNWQNFPRTGELGECIMAPPGHELIICDMAQIECRILNYIAGQWDTLEAFKEGRDIYCEVASAIYRRDITPDNKAERFFGKKTELSSGYGIGAVTLFKRLRGEGVKVTLEQCERAILVYRERHPRVVELWREAGMVLKWLTSLARETWIENILTTSDGAIVLPNGTQLKYDLRWDPSQGNFFRTDRRGTTKIWGSALVGEVTQALASVLLRDVLRNIHARAGLMPVCLRHDEAVYVVPEIEIEPAQQTIYKEFRKAPAWLPRIPLDCEILSSKTYVKL
jgi:DNA polymerase III epsilon subunit-like protein